METSVIIALVTCVTQLGVAAAALKLASALKAKSDNHEIRIVVLEKVTGVLRAE